MRFFLIIVIDLQKKNKLSKADLRYELKLRTLHNQNEIHALQRSIKKTLSSCRDKDLDVEKLSAILCKLMKLNKNVQRTEIDDELDRCRESRLLQTNTSLINALRELCISWEVKDASAMSDEANRNYRLLCNSKIPRNRFHDYNI